MNATDETEVDGIRPANRLALQLLKAWMREPDDLGDEWWDAFELELQTNRLAIKRSQTGPMNSGMTR